MAQIPWNEKFEAVLRQGLPGLGQDKAPAPEVPMETYGLDSMALIGIVGALESAYGISLAGQITVPVRTLTAGQLWGLLSTELQPAWDTGRPCPASGTIRDRTTPWIMA